MLSDSETFIAHVAAHAGVTVNSAEAITRTMLARIGTALTPVHRRQVADELPPALAQAVMTPEVMPDIIVDDAISVHGRELIASVCRVLAEELSGEALGWLRGELPPRLADLLVPGAPPTDTAPAHGTNLATGRPGSTRPLSESHLEPNPDTLAEGHPGWRRKP